MYFILFIAIAVASYAVQASLIKANLAPIRKRL